MAPSEKTFDGGFSQWDGAVFVGIDQSYTGFAMTFIDPDGAYISWVYKSPHTGIDRLMDIEQWIIGKLSKLTAVCDAAVEAPVLRSPSALISGQLFSIVLRTLYVHGSWRPLQVPPTMLKKFVTGKGTGVQKNQMLLETYKRWGAEFRDDNAADSYGLARIAAGMADTAFQREVLAKLHDPKFRQ